MKNYDEWNSKKKKLNNLGFIPPKINESEFWWVKLGLNIGEEIDGKGKNFSRPVLILKRINRRNYLVLPGTTTERIGIMYHKINFEDGVIGYFCLNQIRVISYKRFDKKYSSESVSDLDFYNIKNKLSDYYFGKLIPPPEAGGTEDDTAPHIKSIIPNTNILSNENL